MLMLRWLILFAFLFSQTANAIWHPATIQGYLEQNKNVLLVEVVSSESVSLTGVSCGIRTKIKVLERFFGSDEITEVGTIYGFSEGQRLLLFIREGRGNFPNDVLPPNPETGLAKWERECVETLPNFSADHRATGEIVRLRSDSQDDYANIDLVGVSRFLDLPEPLAAEIRTMDHRDYDWWERFENNDWPLPRPKMTAIWRDNVLPWTAYRKHLREEIREFESK